MNHSLDGITNLKYKLVHFLTYKKNRKELKAQAYSRDRSWTNSS